MRALPLYALATLLMTAMSALVHGLSQDMPLGQLIFGRSLGALPPIVLYGLWRGGRVALRPHRPALHLTRGLIGAAAMGSSFLSLKLLDVTTAEALRLLAPILVVLLAALSGQERLSRNALLGVTLGALGGLVILGGVPKEPAKLIGIAAGLTFAVLMAVNRLHVKVMTRSETPASIALSFAVICTVLGLLSAPFGWAALDLRTVLGLALVGLLGGLGHVLSAEAIRLAPVSKLAPLDYLILIWALGFDLILFAHWPGLPALLGAALIAAAGLTARRI